MKIKDIVNEQGFISGLARSLTPSALKPVIDAGKTPVDPSDWELAQAAYKKFGEVPNKEGEPSNLGAPGWLTPDQLKQRIAAAKEKALKNKETAKKLAAQTTQTAKDKLTRTPRTVMDRPEYGAENIPQGHRIAVTNPQGNATFYKYPDGKWTDEYGTVIPSAVHGTLNQFADTRGRMEPLPTQTTSGFKPKRGRRAR